MRTVLGRTAALLVLLACAAGLTAVGGAQADPSPTPTASSPAGSTDTGRRVFLRDCSWCHGTTGGGTGNGPSLESSGALDADFYLRTGRMPLEHPDDRVERGPVAYSDDVIESLDAYVASLGDGPGVTAVAPGDAETGRRLFLGNCAACHSASGTGMVMTGGNWAPELDPTEPQQVAEAIRIGPGPMPAFTDKQLEKQEVDDIVSYVEKLGPDQQKGGATVDQYGPIVEGLLVWLVGLPLLLLVIRLLGKKAKP